MNSHSSRQNVVFKNPENKPLEELLLDVQTEGVIRKIPALDKQWAVEKCILFYEVPKFEDNEGREIIGAKETWVELVSFIIEDYNWLLRLPFYRFWSTVVYNNLIMDSLMAFLLEAPTVYTLNDFPMDPTVRQLFHNLHCVVLKIFARLVTAKESPSEYMNQSYLGNLLYDKFIISVPTLMDLCQQYGRSNKKVVEKIVNTVFTLEPRYFSDLEEVVRFLIQTLRNIERKFEDCPIDQAGQAVLLSQRGGARAAITLEDLEDQIMYFLDSVSNLSIFVDIYPESAIKFQNEEFLNKIVNMYANTIPEMYKKLDDLAYRDETIEKYLDLKQRLDVIRIEIINLYRSIVYVNIEKLISAQLDESNVDDIVDDFLTNITNALAESEFLIDYNKYYPFIDDYEILLTVYPDLNTIKCQFILDSIDKSLAEILQPTNYKNSQSNNLHAIACSSSSNISNYVNEASGLSNSDVKNDDSKTESDIFALISEVKDILCDLGEGFIQKCLEHYHLNTTNVINAVLEDTLPQNLKSLDRSLPFIPPDQDEKRAAVEEAMGIQRLNIYDNDEFDIMTRDSIDKSKIHKGKKKDKYKNLNQLLNDKSHLDNTRDIYHRYSMVTSEYDDEYDDTYDSQDIGCRDEDENAEMDGRRFTVPRVLQKHTRDNMEDDDDEEEEFEEQVDRDHFVQDPALLREKAQERRMSKQGIKSVPPSKNVTGGPRGQGQSKEVLHNRDNKNKNKASRANHNRRTGSQWKRNQGMVPS